MTRAVDLFAGGPAGWDLAAHAHGIDSLGLEWDRHACATRAAIGLPTIRTDVAAWPTHRLAATGIDVLLGSPPCTMFSAAGTRSGADAVDLLAPAMRRVYAGDDVRAAVIDAITTELTPTVEEELAELNRKRTENGQPPRSIDVPGDAAVEAHRRARMAALVLEPARYAHDLTPDVIALEQVPEVLPLWRVLAEELRLAGYSAWAGVLNAADFGVPQTRRRAILIANRTRTITAPEPTHAQNPTPSLFGELAPWVTMAEALGWHPDTTVGFPRLDDKGDSPDGYRSRVGAGPAPSPPAPSPDLPLAGPSSAQFLQVGNAIPPLLAYHALRAAIGTLDAR